MDPSIDYFIIKLNNLIKNETFDYCFYDIEREEMKEKNKFYNIIEQIKNNKKYMKPFCDEINTKLSDYEITHIGNIICGKTYKYKNRTTMPPIQISDGYYYSFTVICKKKLPNTKIYIQRN
jgi:hypothetical protein